MERQKEWFEKIKQNKTYAVICIVIALLCFMPVLFDLVSGRHPYSYAIGVIVENSDTIPESQFASVSISAEKVSQTFICDLLNVAGIKLKVVTLKNMEKGTILVGLYDDETDSEIGNWEVPLNTVEKDGSFIVNVRKPLEQGDVIGRRFRVDISAKDTEDGEDILLYYIPSDWYVKGKFMINEAEAEGDLVMEITGCEDPVNMMMPKCFMCLYFTAFAEWLAYVIYRRIGKKKVDKEQDTDEKA